MVWVLQNSKAKLGSRLVHIALAEFAHDDGTKAFPSVQTLMERTLLSERGVQDCLKKLQASGDIVKTGATKYGTNIYTVVMDRKNLHPRSSEREGVQNGARGVQSSTDSLFQTAPDPSVEPSRGPVKDPQTVRACPSKVNRKDVTMRECELAWEILDAFNERFGSSFVAHTWLTKIIGRIREHPMMVFEQYRHIIDNNARAPWWKDEDPSPSVIFGNDAVFEKAMRCTGRAMPRTRGERKAARLGQYRDALDAVRVGQQPVRESES